MDLRAKIVLPFLFLFLLVLAAAVWLAVDQVTDAVEERLLLQTHDFARVITRTGFRPTGPFLAKVREASGADAVLTDPAGGYVEGTIDRTAWQALGPVPVGDRPVTRAEVTIAAADLAYPGEPVSGRLFLLFPAAQIRDQKRRAAWPLFAVACAGVGLAGLVGFGIARRIARPLVELAAQAQAIAHGGETPLRVPATGDEIEQLGRAFEQTLASLARHQADLRRAERESALGKLAAAIAHEVRNPLTSMKLTLQLLERGEGDAERRRGFALVLQEVERLRLLVDEMLDLGGAARLERAPTDLNALVRDCLVLIGRQAEHRGVTVAAELGPLPPALPLDPGRIKQVILNLLLNALDAMPRGGPLAVRTLAAPAGSSAVRLEVADRGTGIPAAARDRLFEPFFSTKPGGVGLGLAICKRVVEDHGGRIGFAPADGGGTFFWVELPTS